jgi:hypothetical protein
LCDQKSGEEIVTLVVRWISGQQKYREARALYSRHHQHKIVDIKYGLSHDFFSIVILSHYYGFDFLRKLLRELWFPVYKKLSGASENIRKKTS